MNFTKRIGAFFVSAMMVATLIAGCGSSTEKTPTSSEQTKATGEQTTTQTATTPAKKFKIGFSYYSYTDATGEAFKEAIEYTAKELGAEAICTEWPQMSQEGALQANQDLLQKGVDGLIAIFAPPGLIDACKQKNVPLAQFAYIPASDVMKTAADSGIYVGTILTDEVKAGYNAGQGMYDKGCRNVAYLSLPAGTSVHDNRVKGFEQFAKEHSDFKILSNFRGAADKQIDAFKQIVSSYPNLDGIYVTANSGSIVNTIYTDGLDKKVKFAAFDAQEGTDQQLKDGVMVFLGCGQQNVAQLATVNLIYRLANGKNLLPDVIQSVNSNYIYLKSSEDYDNYMKYLQGGAQAYNGDELRSMTSFDIFNKFAMDYSIEDVVARHSK